MKSPLNDLDLSVLTPEERHVIEYSLVTYYYRGRISVWMNPDAAVLAAPIEMRTRVQGTLDRLIAPTKRRGPILEVTQPNPAFAGFLYRVIPEALIKYLASKKPKRPRKQQ